MKAFALRDDDARVLNARYTREQVVQALRDYAEAYGPDFSSAAFNPSLSMWRSRPELAERYAAGHPKTGKPWPSLNAIKRHFDGSWNAARAAADLPAMRPGGPRRAAHANAPIRNVQHRVVTLPPKQSRYAIQRADRAEARAMRAEAKVARLSAENERLVARVRELEDAAASMVRELAG